MPKDPQTRCWVRTGILSLLLAVAPLPAPLALNLSDTAEAPAAAPLPEVHWLQTLAALLGPSLTTAIHQGRDRAYPHGQRVPEAIRSTLAPFFPRAVLQKARYSTAWQDATAQDTLLKENSPWPEPPGPVALDGTVKPKVQPDVENRRRIPEV